MHDEHKIKIFTCKASRDFAEKVAAKLGLRLGDSDVLTFSDGEFQPCYNESVRGATVFIIQSTCPPTDNLFELLLMIDAAKRASAHKVIAVCHISDGQDRTARINQECRSVQSS